MSRQKRTEQATPTGDSPSPQTPYHQKTEDYGADRIQARHGRVNFWLLLVYLVMFFWALYYGYTFWGGLGPGLNLNLG